MNGSAEIFESHRSRLFGIAYRILGTRADAEDVLQDAYLRWHEATVEHIQSPIAFLVTITTRLCLDCLRDLKKERELYTGPWVPEPNLADHIPSPEEQCETAGEVSVAFLAVLERLGPQERAAFLLREVFDYDYSEVARIVDKSESACRQLVHRALSRVHEARPRFVVVAESRERVLSKFLAAIGTNDREAVLALLTEEVKCIAAGRSPRRPGVARVDPIKADSSGPGNAVSQTAIRSPSTRRQSDLTLTSNPGKVTRAPLVTLPDSDHVMNCSRPASYD
jgi:RNA polymerase sigma-70 factor (ECF subfamily)